MKALSIKQPWAWLIATGQKDIENRTWPTNFRGRLYIHAGKKIDYLSIGDFISGRFDIDKDLKQRLINTRSWPVGAIIGEVDIVDCVVYSSSRWFVGPFGFLLNNAFLYDKPVPYKGRLGLFEVNLTT